ncbi:MAG: ArsA-related P-loop ATPase, partial [Eubacterium sp.]
MNCNKDIPKTTESFQMNDTKVIAFSGKGGVGKTSLAALTVRLIVEEHPEARVLAIDADPAIGLSTALGVVVTHTVDDIRKKFIETVGRG